MKPRTGVPSPDVCKDWCSPRDGLYCMGACCPHLHTKTTSANKNPLGQKEARR